MALVDKDAVRTLVCNHCKIHGILFCATTSPLFADSICCGERGSRKRRINVCKYVELRTWIRPHFPGKALIQGDTNRLLFKLIVTRASHERRVCPVLFFCAENQGFILTRSVLPVVCQRIRELPRIRARRQPLAVFIRTLFGRRCWISVIFCCEIAGRLSCAPAPRSRQLTRRRALVRQYLACNARGAV